MNTDLIHCNDLETLPIGVIIKKFFNKNIKIVYDAHEYETEVHWHRGIKKSIIKIVKKSLIRYADCVITVNDSIAKEYTKLYSIPIPYVVSNCPPYHNSIEQKNIFRKVFGIKKNQIIFLYQGRPNEDHGIEIIFKTFSKVNKAKVIIFIGSGSLEKIIKSYAERYSNIYIYIYIYFIIKLLC